MAQAYRSSDPASIPDREDLIVSSTYVTETEARNIFGDMLVDQALDYHRDFPHPETGEPCWPAETIDDLVGTRVLIVGVDR